jgi:hypothetical protein
MRDRVLIGEKTHGMNSASLCSLAGRYDKPIPPRFLVPIDGLKIPGPVSRASEISFILPNVAKTVH